MEGKTELRDILRILRSRLWLIVVLTVGAAVSSGLASHYLLPRIYRSTTTLLVLRQETQAPLDYTSVLLSRQLVKTYRQIALSRTVTEAVARELQLDLPPEAVSRKIRVDALEDTEIIRIEVEDTSPTRARLIADKTADVFIRQVRLVVNAENIQVIDPAVVNRIPVKPQLRINILAGMLLGLLVGVAAVFLLEYLDNSLKTAEDVYACLELPVLGTIPWINAAQELKQAGLSAVGSAAPVRTEEGIPHE